VTARNGDGPDGAVGAIEAGQVVELDGINTKVVAANSVQAQDKTADTAVRPVDPVVVVCTPAGYGKRGPLFSASFDGRTIVTASVTPFLDAARVLAGEGVDPATRIVGKDYDALTSTIGAAAGLDVANEYFVKHRPRKEGVETAAQTAAHTPEPVGGSATPPQPSSAPGGMP
jgi:hypothetical protein